ncbi:MAG: hypothetical protein WBC37_13345 [Burkholderiaceae bacterium]
MRWRRYLLLAAAIAGVLAAGPALANAERERMMLAALLRCDLTYATEPYASHVEARDLAELDRAHGALQAHLTRAFSAREAQLLVARTVDERQWARPRTDRSPSAAVGACRRVVAGAINAYSWSRTWQAWIERN